MVLKYKWYCDRCNTTEETILSASSTGDIRPVHVTVKIWGNVEPTTLFSGDLCRKCDEQMQTRIKTAVASD